MENSNKYLHLQSYDGLSYKLSKFDSKLVSPERSIVKKDNILNKIRIHKNKETPS